MSVAFGRDGESTPAGPTVSSTLQHRASRRARLAPRPAACSVRPWTTTARPAYAPRLSHCGIVCQAGRPPRLRPDDRRPGLDKLLDLAQRLRRHRAVAGQHQQPIAHAVGQHDAAVLDRHAMQQGIAGAAVVVVARRQMLAGAGRSARPRRHRSRHRRRTVPIAAGTGSGPGTSATRGLVPTR